MAQFDLSSGHGPAPYKSPFGQTPIFGGLEVAASTFRAGNIVEQAATTNSHRIRFMSTNSTTIVGIAAAPASSVLDTVLTVYEANPLVEFKAAVKETIASTLVGARRSWAYDSTLGIHYIDQNATGASVVITGLITDIGTSNGLVSFRFLSSAVSPRFGL
jgi:hypothetical protein